MRLLLHCGLPKTGSTALQSALHRGGDHLRAVGVSYPRPEHGPIHNTLLFLPLPDTRYPMVIADAEGGLDAARASGRACLARAIEAAQDPAIDTMILSSELVATPIFRPEDIAALAKELSVLTPDIQPIVYVREPAAQYLSYLQESLKSRSQPMRPRALRLQEQVTELTRVFAKAPVLCAYDRKVLVNGDIVDDFLHRFLPGRLAPGTLVPVHDNTTLSGEGMIVLQQARLILAEGMEGRLEKLSRGLVPKIKAAEATLGLSKPKLRADVVAAIRAASHELLWLRATTGIVFDEVDCDAITGAPIPDEMIDRPLDQLIEVDLAKCDELADAVQAQLWQVAIDFLG